MKAYINGIEYYLPKAVLTNEDINKEYPEWSVDKISNKTGIFSRHISKDDEFVSDMSVCALQMMLAERPFLKERIDFILLCTQSPDYSLPTTACIVQDRAGLNKTCGALDFNLGCSGYIYGLGLAKGLILSGQAENIALITAETYSKMIHPKDKSNKTIFGDAASVTLVTARPDHDFFSAEILDFQYGTDGKGFDNLIVRNSGAHATKRESNDTVDEDGNFISNESYLFMNGREIFNFTAFEVPSLIDSVLARNSLIRNDISTYIFHQANAYMLDVVRKRSNIPADRFYVSLDDVGNTVSSTIPIALKRYSNSLVNGSSNKILLAGFGVGLSMGATVLQTV